MGAKTGQKHGRDHAAGGSDPLPNGTAIQFDLDNEGGSLEIHANEPIPGQDESIILDAGSDDLTLTGTGRVDIDGAGVHLTSTTSIDLLATTASIYLSSVAATLGLNFPTADAVVLKLLQTTTGKFVIQNHSGTPIFQVDENGTITPALNLVSSVFSRTGAVVAVAGDYYGVVAAGLTGATAASRYVGATASGSPASGTFAIGDFVVDRSGSFWICTTAGTPGTWAEVAGGGGGGITFDTANSGGYLDITTSGDVTLNLGSGAKFNVQAAGVGAILEVDESAEVVVRSDDGSPTAVFEPTGDMTFNLRAGTDFEIYDSGINPIFQVFESGEIFANLPTSPGTAGSLYNSLGFVKVA